MKDILGIDIDTYRKRIEFQMTPGMNWKNFDNDYVRPISSFDVSNNEGLQQAFLWITNQHSIEKIHQQKRTQFDFVAYIQQ